MSTFTLNDTQRDALGRVRSAMEQGKRRQQTIKTKVNRRYALYRSYQERRDRLAGLQEAVDRAARKVQERKRQLDTEEEKCRQRRQQEALQRAEVDKRAAIVEEHRHLRPDLLCLKAVPVNGRRPRENAVVILREELRHHEPLTPTR